MAVPTKEIRISRWYFGGIASMCAACCTHPLDLIKVHLQTQLKADLGMAGMAKKLLKTDGFLAFYNGLSASLLRQLTYSTTRFGIYETMKNNFSAPGQPLPFYKSIMFAAVSGAIGGLIGTPADMINVRMQNDVKLLPAQRRNYKHAMDGLVRVYREEGPKRLFSGGAMATVRAVFVTIGQLAFYDQFKLILVNQFNMGDNLMTHFSASISAGAVATLMTQPLDVLKTRLMNNSGEGLGVAVKSLLTVGPSAFFKGFVPAFIRLGPHTILTFVFLEQIRQNFGVITRVPDNKKH